MKKILLPLLLLTINLCSMSQKISQQPSTGQILLKQLKETQSIQGDWFVPLQVAIQHLSPLEANWKPDDSSHSIGQLVNHLLFWNRRGLNAFKGIREEPHKGSNAETFSTLNPSHWNEMVEQMGSLCAEWEQSLADHADNLAAQQIQIVSQLSTHNTYHTGQIMYIRKLQHSWDASRGVR